MKTPTYKLNIEQKAFRHKLTANTFVVSLYVAVSSCDIALSSLSLGSVLALIMFPLNSILKDLYEC